MEPKKIDELDAKRCEAAQLAWQLAQKEAEHAVEKAKEKQRAFARAWEAMCAKYEVESKAARVDYETLELKVE